MAGIYSPFSNPVGIKNVSKLLTTKSFKIKTRTQYDENSFQSGFQLDNTSNVQYEFDANSIKNKLVSEKSAFSGFRA